MKLSRLLGIPSLAMVLMGALMLASCGTVAPAGGSGVGPPIVSTRGSLNDERALYAVEAAYNVAAHAYVTADTAGQLPAALKARVRPVLVSSYQALLAARAAYAAGDAATFTAQARAAVEFATQARELIPK